MTQYPFRKKAFALAIPILFWQVLANAQVPSDSDIETMQQYRGAHALPNGQSIEEVRKQLAVPDKDLLNAQMNRLRGATQKALGDPSLNSFKGPVPKDKFKAATKNERERYLANVEQDTRHALGNHTTSALESLPSVIERYQQEQDRAVRRMKSDVPDVPEDAVLVFVSFSMPESILSSLAKQAKVVGATLVLRGMKEGSLRETKGAALAVNGAGAAWQINPGLFESFKVNSVPTFIVTGNKEVLDHGCPLDAADSCSLAGAYASISGDLSIELALETIRVRSDIPYVRSLAQDRLARLKAKRAG